MAEGDDEVREEVRRLREELAASRAQIAALAQATIEQATAITRLAAVSKAPSTGKTLAAIYELDEATWSTQTWARSMRSTLAPALRHFEGRAADAITRQDWIHYRDHVRAKQTTIRKGPPTPYSLNQEILRWRTLYRRQMEEGNCATNPLVGIRPIRGAKKHRETEPTLDDLMTLQRHCSARLWAFVLLAFRRGFRANEARRLEWRQVDLERGRILLQAWQEKTRRQQIMRITSDVVSALRVIKPDVPGRYVFQGRSGPLGKTTLWNEFRTAVDRAGLEAAPGDGRVTFHDHRHSFTSNAARQVPLQVAMRLSRHRNLSTAARYIHVNDSDLEDAYEKLEDAVRKGPRKVGPQKENASPDLPKSRDATDT